MNDESEVGFVISHPECTRRYNCFDSVVQKIFLYFRSFFGQEPACVCLALEASISKEVSYSIRFIYGKGVDDAGTWQLVQSVLTTKRSKWQQARHH